MSKHAKLVILRVGVPVPNVSPKAGGSFEFQQTVFAEILKRIEQAKDEKDTNVQFIPIATSLARIEGWEIDPRQVLCIAPSRSIRVRSELDRRIRRLRHPLRAIPSDQTLASKATNELLLQNFHVIWSLYDATICDQLPFILTTWDLQHRLQPFFPEVSRSGEWEARESHYASIGRKAFLNVVGTKRGMKELEKFFGVDPRRVLINPFPCPPPVKISDQEATSLLQQLFLCSREFLLYPAQFWAHKNHITALLGLRQLVDQGHSFKLVLTGSDKGTLNAIKNFVDALGLRASVVYAGFVERKDLAILYSHCFALIYPSFFGPDNIPPLEAMSYRAPAIVADVPGNVEQYGDAVLRFNPRSPEQMVGCVNRLVNEVGLRNKLIKNGLNLISGLTPTEYVKRMESFLAAETLPLICSGLGTVSNQRSQRINTVSHC